MFCVLCASRLIRFLFVTHELVVILFFSSYLWLCERLLYCATTTLTRKKKIFSYHIYIINIYSYRASIVVEMKSLLNASYKYLWCARKERVASRCPGKVPRSSVICLLPGQRHSLASTPFFRVCLPLRNESVKGNKLYLYNFHLNHTIIQTYRETSLRDFSPSTILYIYIYTEQSMRERER